MSREEQTEAESPGSPLHSMWEMVAYFLRLGALGFGGPVALVGYMQRDLVETRGWVTPQDYKEGLALAQLAPGPLAAQLAIYLGWLRGGVGGATLVGLAFVLPSFLMVMALSAVYLRFGGIGWMQGAFYGVGAAVIALIGLSAYKLLKATLGKNRLLFAICAVSAVVTAVTESELIWLIVLSGFVALAAARNPAPKAAMVAPLPAWLVTGLHGPAPAALLWKVAAYFAAAGAFVFGSGLAIVPFLHGGVVSQYHWLTERQFVDAVAVAMITPGPVVITVAFIGYLVAGPAGGSLAALGVFLPCYLFVVIPARYFRKAAQNSGVRAFVDGVAAAASGAIAGAVFVLGKRAIYDVSTAIIGLVALVALLKLKKVPEPVLILVAAAVGILLRGA